MINKQTDIKKGTDEILSSLSGVIDKKPIIEEQLDSFAPDEAIKIAENNAKSLAPKSIKRIDIIANRDDGVGLQANIAILDRAMGKPTQKVIQHQEITDEEMERVKESLRSLMRERNDTRALIEFEECIKD